MTLSAGSRLGPYEILAPPGAGGMGESYRPRDSRLGREVAVKMLPDAFLTDPERPARFDREAHVLASLNHANVAGTLRLRGVERRSVPPGTCARRDAHRAVSGRRPPSPGGPEDLAKVHIGLGDSGRACEWLERAVVERSARVGEIGVDPIYDSLRKDPRFFGLLRRIGLD